MKDVYLLEFSLQGVKNLDKKITLSFYKDKFRRVASTNKYHVKAVYGMNGAGKSAIITGADILKKVLLQPYYLKDYLSSKKLKDLINKDQKKIDFTIQYLVKCADFIRQYEYQITISKDKNDEIFISDEQLLYKRVGTDKFISLFEVHHGQLIFPGDRQQSAILQELRYLTMNLLSASSLSSQFISKNVQLTLIKYGQEELKNEVCRGLYNLLKFAYSMQVYLEDNDLHEDYYNRIDVLSSKQESFMMYVNMNALPKDLEKEMRSDSSFMPLDTSFPVKKENLPEIEERVKNLYRFIRIFKPELEKITLETKEDKKFFICNLKMQYENYSIDAEFESTGIKKLIRLYSYINYIVNGGIVFIDEMDANLHDVYLCALLEYLIDSAQGQLCFTTHNIGPMHVLEHQKNSIDFLSADHQIVSWKKNGNYKPYNLYREGMIKGSPFNVDETDFVGIFDDEEKF